MELWPLHMSGCVGINGIHRLLLKLHVFTKGSEWNNTVAAPLHTACLYYISEYTAVLVTKDKMRECRFGEEIESRQGHPELQQERSRAGSWSVEGRPRWCLHSCSRG